ncbi:PAS domain S-box protein [Deinococcus hohokamensis]|uniref:PAS domain S-box protein n=1 Tax=Deinococcus hohokamensis TaxID=309883 RepID=A0ABV9I7L9_9DEIO
MTQSPLSFVSPLLSAQVLDACVIGVVVTDARQHDQPIVYVNPAFERLSGYSVAECLGRNCRFLQGQDRDQPALPQLRQALREGQGVTAVLRNYRRDGTIFFNELTVQPLRDEGGTVTHFVGFQHDVTARETAAAQASGPLTAPLEHMADSFAAFDHAWNCIYVNPTAAALVGLERGDLTGRPVQEVFPQIWQRPIGQALQRARASSQPQHEVVFTPELGKWLSATAYPSGSGVALFVKDVSASHQAQEALRLSEERFSKVFQASPVSITISRVRDQRFVAANPEFLAQSGLTLQDVLGRTWHEVGLQLDEEDVLRVNAALAEHGEVRNLDIRLRMPSQEERHNLLSIVPVEIGGEACLVTLVQNVTREKRAQEALKDSEQRARRLAAELQHILDISLDMICTINGEGQFVTVSAACQHMLGYRPDELIGRVYLDFVHPDDRALTVSEERRLGGGWVTSDFQNRYLHKDGHAVWLEWAAVKLPGDDLLYCAARDITRRRAAEEDQAYLAAIVQASHDAIIGLDLQGQIRSWNAGAEQLYGYPAAEAIGQPLSLLVPAEMQQAQARLFDRAGRGERVEPFEAVLRTKAGLSLPVFVTFSPIVDSAGRVVGVSTITQDIRTRKVAESQIRKLNESLEQQLQHITGLREVDRAIASSMDLPLILGIVLDNVRQQLGADAVALRLLNAHTLILECVATRGRSVPLLQAPVSVGQGPAGQVALGRQALRLPDLGPGLPWGAGEQESSAWLDSLVQAGFGAYFAVPMMAKGKVLGVIEVMYQTNRTPSPEAWEMLEMLAGQAAIAVDNAELFQALDQRNLELRLAYDETIEGWARALDLRDRETEGHSRRVTEMTVNLSRRLGVPDEQLVDIRRGALLHDIGKVGIPDAILLKPGPLTAEEWTEMKKHPGYAVDLLSPIRFLRPAMDIPQYHHEKWDGTGYPEGLSGAEIPLAARVFAVVDVYDALTSDRPYRAAWPRDKALEHLQAQAGTHFDARIVDVFLQMVTEAGFSATPPAGSEPPAPGLP